MKSLSRFLLPISAILFMIPQASAGELGDAFTNTIQADQWNYSATADMSLKKDMNQDMPFDVSVTVKEEGGKTGKNYGELGEMTVKVSGFQDLPSEINDLSYVNALMKYRADYEDASQTAYMQFDTLEMKSDSVRVKKVTDMMNQIAKMFTGKAFKISSSELANALSGQMLGMSSEEELAFIRALSGQSVDKSMQAMATAFDGLVQSGVLIESVQNTSVRTSSRIQSSQFHVLTLANSITPQQAEMLRKTLIRLFEQLMAAPMSTEIVRELQNVSSEELAAGLNEALSSLQDVNTQIEVQIAGGLVHSVSFHLDLKKLEVPMEMNMNVSFDYSKGYGMVVSREEKNLIDINKIIEGAASLVEISSSQSSYDYDDQSYDLQSNYYVVLDTIDEIERYVWDICGEDAACRRSQIMRLKRELKDLRRQGIVSHQEYKWILKDLNTLR